MAALDEAHRARLFSVSGIKGTREAEQRAAAALLSVLSTVRPFSQALLSPMGASNAERASVDAYTEVGFDLGDGERARVDGVIVVTHARRIFRCLVEIKVGEAPLEAQQIEKYLKVARVNGFHCLLTVSNEPAPFDGMHPTAGVAPPPLVALRHLSWQRILAEATREHIHRGVDDPEQAWLLAELIRYLEHSNSGVRPFEDMGAHWPAVRDKARDGLLVRGPEVADICRRWDQLIHTISMDLGSKLGLGVKEVVPKAHRADPARRARDAEMRLCHDGTLAGRLRVPDAVADIEVVADLRSCRVGVSSTFDSATDKGARGRVGLLLRQLRDAPDGTVVESFSRKARSPLVATLAEARDDPGRLVRSTKQPPARFRLTQRSEMGMTRRTGRKLGFAHTVVGATEEFYATVLQSLRKAPPPKPAPLPLEPEPPFSVEAGADADHDGGEGGPAHDI